MSEPLTCGKEGCLLRAKIAVCLLPPDPDKEQTGVLYFCQAHMADSRKIILEYERLTHE